jgi:hypothetical protein
MSNNEDKTKKSVQPTASAAIASGSSNANGSRMYPYVHDDESNFNGYLWSLENFFAINGIRDDEGKVRRLMNIIGQTNTQKIINSCLPNDPTSYTFNEIVEKYNKLFCSEKNQILQSYQFNSRYQKENEGLYEFADLTYGFSKKVFFSLINSFVFICKKIGKLTHFFPKLHSYSKDRS